MSFSELSEQTRKDMRFLGHFSPCSDGESFKGYMVGEDGEEGKVYLYESDFRNLAASCLEVAEYLAARKEGK